MTPLRPPSVPTCPEPVEDLRSRYAAALEEIYDQESVALGVAITPSCRPQHVFDFEDGVRLIVSRERTPEGKVVVHFSASAIPECEFIRRIMAWPKHERVAKALDDLVQHFWELAGLCRVRLICVSSGKNIPHWWVEEAV